MPGRHGECRGKAASGQLAGVACRTAHRGFFPSIVCLVSSSRPWKTDTEEDGEAEVKATVEVVYRRFARVPEYIVFAHTR